jgi:hypothetical protein
MGQQELAASRHSSLNGASAGIERYHDLTGGVGRVAHLQSGIIPIFGTGKRGENISYSNYI